MAEISIGGRTAVIAMQKEWHCDLWHGTSTLLYTVTAFQTHLKPKFKKMTFKHHTLK
jgi:hypothetical protein